MVVIYLRAKYIFYENCLVSRRNRILLLDRCNRNVENAIEMQTLVFLIWVRGDVARYQKIYGVNISIYLSCHIVRLTIFKTSQAFGSHTRSPFHTYHRTNGTVLQIAHTICQCQLRFFPNVRDFSVYSLLLWFVSFHFISFHNKHLYLCSL